MDHDSFANEPGSFHINFVIFQNCSKLETSSTGEPLTFSSSTDDGVEETKYQWKCEFTLKGQKGAVWAVEHLHNFDDKCSMATGLVSENNPNASIVGVKNVFIGYEEG